MQLAEDKTVQGHEEPFAVQFSVFLANRVGQLGELLDLLDEKSVRTFGVSVVDATDWAVIRMVCSDSNKAREILRSHQLPFTESQVLLVEMCDDDTLREICGHLLRAEINVHFAYPLALRSRGCPVTAFHVDDQVLATRVLTRHGLTLLGYEDLSDPQ